MHPFLLASRAGGAEEIICPSPRLCLCSSPPHRQQQAHWLELFSRPLSTMEIGAFCLRADGTRYDDDGITMQLCAKWRIFFRRTRGIPQEGVWEMVPERLLPEGAAVCYFCPHTYLQYYVAKKVAPALARNRAVGDRVRVWDRTRKQELLSLRGRCGSIQAYRPWRSHNDCRL